MEPLYWFPMPAQGSDPAQDEATTLPDAIRTDVLHAEIGAPALAKQILWQLLRGSPLVGETDMSPALARTLTRQMRAKTQALRLATRQGRVCRKGHPLAGENIYAGTNGAQCRLCRNTSRRAKRQAA